MAVRQVAAAREVHAEQSVTGLQDAEVDRHVGGRPGVRLDVGVLGAEELLGALDRQPLDHVDELAAAVVAAAGVALGVLVGEHAARRFEHRAADEVLRGDELEPFVLPSALVGDGGRNLGIGGREGLIRRHVESSLVRNPR